MALTGPRWRWWPVVVVVVLVVSVGAVSVRSAMSAPERAFDSSFGVGGFSSLGDLDSVSSVLPRSGGGVFVNGRNTLDEGVVLAVAGDGSEVARYVFGSSHGSMYPGGGGGLVLRVGSAVVVMDDDLQVLRTLDATGVTGSLSVSPAGDVYFSDFRRASTGHRLRIWREFGSVFSLEVEEYGLVAGSGRGLLFHGNGDVSAIVTHLPAAGADVQLRAFRYDDRLLRVSPFDGSVVATVANGETPASAGVFDGYAAFSAPRSTVLAAPLADGTYDVQQVENPAIFADVVSFDAGAGRLIWNDTTSFDYDRLIPSDSSAVPLCGVHEGSTDVGDGVVVSDRVTPRLAMTTTDRVAAVVSRQSAGGVDYGLTLFDPFADVPDERCDVPLPTESLRPSLLCVHLDDDGFDAVFGFVHLDASDEDPASVTVPTGSSTFVGDLHPDSADAPTEFVGASSETELWRVDDGPGWNPVWDPEPGSIVARGSRGGVVTWTLLDRSVSASEADVECETPGEPQ